MTQQDESALSALRIEREPIGKKITGRRKKRKLLYWIIGAVLLILIVGSATGLFGSSTEVETTIVSRMYPSQANRQLTASGYVVAQRKAAVASKATGRLIELNVVEGDKVRKNDILARLESGDIAAALAQAKANVESGRASLLRAQAEFKEAGLQYDRNVKLSEAGAISDAELDLSEARFKSSEAAVSSAEAGIRAFEALVQAANVQLGNTYIRAPFDGTVLTKNADVGEVVAPFGAAANAKGAVVTIADMGSLEVEADVSESNIQKIEEAQSCEIILDAYPDTRYRGQVSKIVPTADRSKATVLTKIRFLELDTRVLPEMSAKVYFLSKAISDEELKSTAPLVVLPSAIQENDGKKTVFVVAEGKLVLREIETGENIGGSVVVRSGLEVGENVVLNPDKSLSDGETVSTVEEK